MDSLALLQPALWQHNPILWYTLAGIVGLMVGSFLNVLILRLPRMMEREWAEDCAELTGQPLPAAPPFNLLRPASHCPLCQHRLRVWENIPLLSYAMLRGRCAACGGAISWRYPLIEALTALLTVFVAWHFGFTWQMPAALVLSWGLLALAVIDLDTQLLPDALTQPLLWLGLLLSPLGLFTDCTSAILGAAAGYLSLWLLFHLFRLLTGKEGMGRGDFKLFALLGAWLGWAALPQIALFSTLTGAAVGMVLIALGRQERHAPMPFGPFLALAGGISLFWGDMIVAAYLRWGAG